MQLAWDTLQPVFFQLHIWSLIRLIHPSQLKALQYVVDVRIGAQILDYHYCVNTVSFSPTPCWTPTSPKPCRTLEFEGARLRRL